MTREIIESPLRDYQIAQRKGLSLEGVACLTAARKRGPIESVDDLARSGIDPHDLKCLAAGGAEEIVAARGRESISVPREKGRSVHARAVGQAQERGRRARSRSPPGIGSGPTVTPPRTSSTARWGSGRNGAVGETPVPACQCQ